MKLIKKYNLVLTLFFANYLLIAQTYNFKNYTTEQGLAQSQVLSIVQDNRGYMWFGTNGGGVSKFDGKHFVTYTTNDGLIDNFVFSIVESKNNEVLFGTSKGLSTFNGIRIKNYGEKEGLKNPFIYKLLNDGDKIWIGTREGVYIFEDNKITPFLLDTTFNKSSVYSIYIDKMHNIWFGTLQNGVVYYNIKTKQTKNFTTANGLNGNLIFSISQNKIGDILIGTEYGLNKINSSFKINNAKEIPGNDNFSINCLLPNNDNGFYIGTHSEGIKNFDFNSNKLLAGFNKTNGLTNNPIQCLFIDRDKNLWIGTNSAGVFKYFNNKIVSYGKGNGLPENYINSVSVDSYNNIWLGIQKNGVIKISGSQLTKTSFDLKNPKALPDNDVNAMLPLENGKMLFGTSDGLCSYENNVFKTIDDGDFKHKYILSLYLDSEKNVLIGTTEGLYKLANGKITKESAIEKYNTNAAQFAIFFSLEDKQNRKWYGTEKGLIQQNKNEITAFNKDNKFINSLVICGVVDERNNIWFGTEEGLYLYNNSSFKKIEKDDGITSSYINLLRIDNNNQLIIGTNNGVDVLNINDYYNKKQTVKHLGKDDGLLSLESYFNSSAIDTAGRILIGTNNGLEIYDPQLDIINSNEVKINISSVKLFFGQEDILNYSNAIDSISLLPKNLVLPFTKNNLTFQFVGISLIAPEKVRYQYQLEGLDEGWTPIVTQNEVTYPSLPPGKYTFKVNAMNNDGVWNKEPVTFAFEILPPWYNTWWFYLICVLVVVTGIVCYNYIKTKKLVADKQKLERVVDERTKELREEKEKVEVINKEVSEQKSELEHKNREITDSIKYAKNIQEALLPSLVETEKAFDGCFILYMPKDIVSGDFFWFSQNETTRYIAAADCTGHGVPGAFMSIVGNTLLNEIVEQKKITAPGDILLELHKGVKIALNQSNQDSQRRDGMDIALCAIKRDSNTIEFSGANRPLWIYRKNNNYELEIIKPNKFPIGGLELEENRTYTNHKVEFFDGDYFYFFSDGFADQFGGPRGKKFMLSNMQKLLLDNLHLPMQQQKQKIKQAFTDWKNNLEQVDDVLVIGIKV